MAERAPPDLGHDGSAGAPDMMSVLIVAAAVTGVAFCLAVSVLKAVVDRLSKRAAAWLLPDGQTWSFRLAWMLICWAKLIVPGERYYYRGWTGSGPDHGTTPLPWGAADEALSDLDEDLASERRVLHPVRLVLPVLTEALRHRAINLRNRGRFWAVAGPMLVIVAVVWLVQLPAEKTADGLIRLGEQKISRGDRP